MCTRTLDTDPRHKSDVRNIFENFVIVTPNDYIFQHVPLAESLEKELPKFCFPFVSPRYGDSPVVVDDRDTFTFVLTEESGIQQFGYCRHIKESGGSVTLICLCILSYLPEIQFFDQVLDVLIDFWDHSLDKVKVLLDGLKKHPIPKGPETITLKPKGETCTFTFPDHRELPSVPANPYLNAVLTKLTPSSALSLFASILFERRIILASTKLSVLTGTAHALATLLYPLHWQHIFIPVLPEALLDYLSAPMPFLVGVHSSLLPKIRKLNLEEVVFCDLDNKQVLTWSNDLATLPPEIIAVLEASLRRPATAIGSNFAQIFLDFFLYLFGNYRDFITLAAPPSATNTPTRPGGRERPLLDFDRMAFLTASGPELRPFLEDFVELQMFHQFLDYRYELMSKPSADAEKVKAFNVDSFTGHPIIPYWWVFDCLFEYERDVKGNRGTDVEAERMAYYKSKVTNKMREGRDKLKPKFSEYSSRMKNTFSSALDKVDSFKDESSTENSPQISRTSSDLGDSQSRTRGFMKSMSLFGSDKPKSPPQRPRPPEHYVSAISLRQRQMNGSGDISEDGHDPYASRPDTPDSFRHHDNDLLDLNSPQAAMQPRKERVPSANLLDFDEAYDRPITVTSPTFAPNADPMEPIRSTNVSPAPQLPAALSQELTGNPSLTDWSEFESALITTSFVPTSMPTIDPMSMSTKPPTRPSIPPRTDSITAAHTIKPTPIAQPNGFTHSRSASLDVMAVNNGTSSQPAAATTARPPIPSRPAAYVPYDKPPDYRTNTGPQPLATTRAAAPATQHPTPAYHSINVHMRSSSDAPPVVKPINGTVRVPPPPPAHGPNTRPSVDSAAPSTHRPPSRPGPPPSHFNSAVPSYKRAPPERPPAFEKRPSLTKEEMDDFDPFH